MLLLYFATVHTEKGFEVAYVRLIVQSEPGTVKDADQDLRRPIVGDTVSTNRIPKIWVKMTSPSITFLRSESIHGSESFHRVEHHPV